MDSNCGLKHEPINVIAHSQGTVIVTAALQDGMKVDNVIFLGSPMDREEVENQSNNINFRTAAKNVKGSLWNY